MTGPGRLMLCVGPSDTLPALDRTEEQAVLARFRDQVGALAVANAGNRAWWFSWLSSRDRYHCPLAADLVWLRTAEVWLSAQSGDVRLNCPDTSLARALAQRAQTAGWRVRVPLARPDLSVFKDGAKALAIGLLGWWAARRHRAATLEGHDVLLVSWADKRLIDAKTPHDGVYFGPLEPMLVEAGEHPLQVMPLMCTPGQMGTVTAAAVGLGMATMGHGLHLGDVLISVGQAMTERVRWVGPDRVLLRRALFRHVIYSAQARMIERAMRRILTANPRARVIRIYENLPWERAVDLAARRMGRHVTGYLHCAVLPSHLNYYIDAAEGAVRPQPDRVVCTGPAAREVLLSLGPHDPERVAPGMALRGPNPALLNQVDTARPIRRILVLLEGLPRMVHLLKVLDQAARALPELEFQVRAHPMMPLQRLAEMAGIVTGTGQPLREARAGTLEEAIAEADAVVYQGTTAALSAAVMGVALLWFDAGLPITDDPLFLCPYLKRGFADPAGLADAIAGLDRLDALVWQEQRQALRAYVLDYLRAPSAAGLADFRVAPASAVGAH